MALGEESVEVSIVILGSINNCQTFYLGDTGVGKSTLISTYQHNDIVDEYAAAGIVT